MYTLFTDTDTDTTKKIADHYGYRLISMPYAVEATETLPYIDFEEFDSHTFYDMLRSGVMPRTGSISEMNYVEYFEPEFAEGRDILYVHFSRNNSSTFKAMDRAVASLKEKYPGREFYEIDSRAISVGALAVVCEVGDLYLKGCSVEEILKWAETEVDHFAAYFFVDDLKFLQKSGRVGGIAGFVGNFLGVRPMLYMSAGGNLEVIGKERGRLNAMRCLVAYVEELGEDLEKHRIIIGHADVPELAERLKQMLIERFGENLWIETVPVNPTVGCHSGPDTLGLSFHARCRLSQRRKK